MLSWRSLVSDGEARFSVKGTELCCAIIPNTLARFAVYEVRSLGADGKPDRYFRIRDAAGVSDEEVRKGARAPVVWQGDDFNADKIAKLQNMCSQEIVTR